MDDDRLFDIVTLISWEPNRASQLATGTTLCFARN
ncbi:hypothetical protein ACVW1C_003019 [Bradyrhizobium sp. USDA 4011]